MITQLLTRVKSGSLSKILTSSNSKSVSPKALRIEQPLTALVHQIEELVWQRAEGEPLRRGEDRGGSLSFAEVGKVIVCLSP